MDVQLVIHGLDEADSIPMLAIVDGLEQTDIDLTWEQFAQVTANAVAALGRLGHVTRPCGP